MYARHSCAAPFQRLKRRTREAQRSSAMKQREHAPAIQTADTQAFMERDLSEQVAWLAYRAKSYGYADLNDLFGSAPAVYTQLAATWRQTHPPTAMA